MNEPVFKVKTEEEMDGYGRFSIEPLDQGYGQTLGNSIRRVLLTSLPGAAITEVSFEGVDHQFAVVPGMKEDVNEFILNVKQIRLHMDRDEKVSLTLTKSGPGELTAGDIEAPAGVTVVNPELVLGTLADKKTAVSMTFVAQKGFGYVPVEERRGEGVLGTILVDALYSPVRRVNYRVEATRVGRMTNLDRLVMEIWTDKTIVPSVAMKEAAKILIAYFTQLVHPKSEVEEQTSNEPASISDEILKMRIEEFDIPTRIVNALAKGSIETIGQLLGTPKDELMRVKNLGAKSLEVVAEKLKEKGIVLSI